MAPRKKKTVAPLSEFEIVQAETTNGRQMVRQRLLFLGLGNVN
jgi:hypothetical protein